MEKLSQGSKNSNGSYAIQCLNSKCIKPTRPTSNDCLNFTIADQGASADHSKDVQKFLKELEGIAGKNAFKVIEHHESRGRPDLHTHMVFHKVTLEARKQFFEFLKKQKKASLSIISYKQALELN